MNKTELISLTSKTDEEIIVCKIIEEKEGYIRFAVDEGLTKPRYHLRKENANRIIDRILEEDKIDTPLRNIIAYSFKGKRLNYPGADVVYKCFIKSFAEHRPLVLSPDIIWLLINQTIAKHINDNAEKFRTDIVDFQGKKDLIVESDKDLLKEKADWSHLLDGFYEQIKKHTEGSIASTMRSDFTTTGEIERIASIVTLMGAVQSYFDYEIQYIVCGIPHITLLGTVEDWRKVLKKSRLMKKFGLGYWYSWLAPILKEFIRTAEGKPNAEFWRNMVLKTRPDYFGEGRGCVPGHIVDGWCAALFPFVEGERQLLSETDNNQDMDTEMFRVGFKYKKLYPDGHKETYPMELWAGFIGVEEDRETYAFTPQIGWFVRRSVAEEENLAKLQEQYARRGKIVLYIAEVPELIKKIPYIRQLVLFFTNGIKLPQWLEDMNIGQLVVYGEIDESEEETLRKRFKSILINPENQAMYIF